MQALLSRLGFHGPQATLAKGAGQLFLVRSLRTPLVLIAQVVVARFLGVTAFGEFAFVFAMVQLGAFVIQQGLNSASVRLVSAYRSQKELPLLSGFIKWTRRWVLGSAVLLSVGAALVAMAFQASIPRSLYLSILSGCLLLPATAFLLLLASQLHGLQLVLRGDIVHGLVRPVASVVFLILAIFLIRLPPTSHVALLAYVLATLLACVLCIGLIRKALGAEVRSVSPSYLPNAWLRTGVAFLVISLGATVMAQTDIIMIGSLLGTLPAGPYSAAARIALLVAFAANAGYAVMAPKVAEFHASGKLTQLQSTITFIVRLSFLIGAFLFAGVVVCGSLALEVFGEGFGVGYVPMVLLGLGQLLSAAAGPSAMLMTMVGQEKEPALVFIGCAAGNIILNVVMIPVLGLTGAALATGFSGLTCFVVLAFRARSVVGLRSSVFA